MGMSEVAIRLICFFIGGLVGAVVMATMRAGSDADDALLGDKQYRED